MAALIPAGITAAGSIISAILNRRESKQTPMQGKQQELVDQLLASLNGNGPYSNLFNVDEESFQKSYVDPMKQKFESQIAPQIQQSYIASGQHRGTGMQGALTRAGVDIDQLLNQQYAQMQQGAMNRQSNMMGSILGASPGEQDDQSYGSAAKQGAAGFLSGTAGKDALNDIGSFLGNFATGKKGFEKDTREKNELADFIAKLGNQNQAYNYATGIQR